MTRRVLEIVTLVAGFAIILTVALAGSDGVRSTHSTYDDGKEGYEALFNVLRGEGVDVRRLEKPLGLLDPDVRVIAVVPDSSRTPYDAADLRRLRSFASRGGSIVYFRDASAVDSPLGKNLKKHVTYLDAGGFTNAALDAQPSHARIAYDALAGRGPVVFDETLHGYVQTATLWSILPVPVRAAFYVAALAALLAIVGANVRFAPPVAIVPPQERDSREYLDSMAALLERARAGQAAIARFARACPSDRELRDLAQEGKPGDAAVLRAAQRYALQRKERA